MGKNITQSLIVILLLGLTWNSQSQDLHDDSNAASVTNEADATTGWTSGNATLSSESGDPQSGNFFLRLVSSAAGGRTMNYSFNADNGQDYTIRIWAREGAQVSANPLPAFAIWNGLSGFTTTSITGTNWTEYVFNVTATSTTPNIRIYTGNSSTSGVAGNTVEVDNISIVPVGGDTTPPGVVVGSAESSPTGASPIPVTITFDEPVTGFDIGDLAVGNGSAGNFNGTGDTYTVDITPASDGTVTVDIASGVATDTAGNGNTAAVQFSIDYDSDQPGVVIGSTESSPTGASPIPVTITFDEPVTGFDIGDLAVGNGSAGNFNGTGDTYTVDITPASDGTVTVDVPADSAINGSGNGNTAAAQFSIDYDGTPPGVVVGSTESSPTGASPVPVTITFDEPVTGFDIGDLAVGNGSAGNFNGTGDTYTVDITPASDGTVTVDIAAGVATDTAGNGNTAAAQFSIDYDSDQPGVVVGSTESSPTGASPIPVTITFDEPVTGFDIGDLAVGNGSAGNFNGTGDTYTVDITPASDGTVTVDVPADSAINGSGNGNTAAAQFSIDYDGTPPGVVVGSTESSPTGASPVPVTITFDESVTGFDIGDLAVGNGSAGNFNGTGDTYTVDITPTTEGTVTVDIAAGVATDTAGNGNTAAAQFGILYQTTDAQAPDAITDLSSFNITDTTAELLWTEPYDNVGVTDYEVFQDGSSLGFTGGAISYNVAGLSPETSYAFTVYAHDEAGNISGISNVVIVNTTVVHYTTANANLTTVDWRTRDLFVNQNLGIGTTNTQGYRLAIAGNAIAESMKVELQANWPDFVFNESFELPSLEEVAQYIKDKGHLKGIPSAQEVRQTGIDLGDMNARLLQKIEELTLYTIKQEMELKALKKENKKIQVLTERLEALERRLEQK
ncbi:beta strand repeat-containing protein [Ulvibacterium marinum]|uniref:beta strand repeat-containing protein n=1 Tax=Ulvibacterium marinum TaxID=2419782 RepID=UPI0024958904|nr:Ig-like domain-containing protein [Ulvibacterium marinum]